MGRLQLGDVPVFTTSHTDVENRIGAGARRELVLVATIPLASARGIEKFLPRSTLRAEQVGARTGA